jgi:HAE1 family hydrophobic/amphiphilic exporter-1
VHIFAIASMKNKALIALVAIVVAVFGTIALTGLKQELAPSVSFPQLAILTSYPGASPDVVNHDISTPIETAIQGVPDVESTKATSSTNFSLISVSFGYGSDLLVSEQKINQAISRIKSQLPDGVDPQVITGSFADFPVLQIAVSSSKLTALQLADLLRASTIGDIKKLDGVRDAALVGAPKQRVTITPDADKLRSHGITASAIKDTFQANGVLIPAGSITQNGKTLVIQIGDQLTTTKAIANLPIVGSKPQVTIGDVATVVKGVDPQSSLSRVNGEPALTIAVTKLPSANIVEVSKLVNSKIPALQSALGSDVTMTVVFDQAPYIEKSIESLTTEGLLGLGFAVIIILLFLLSVRSTLVTAISIPTSVLITFIGLQAANYSLNILTLGALTIAIGRVVDDSIVVIENIKRKLVWGADRSATIVEAVKEVAGAVTASTATTVAVFLPIAFVGGITGELFRPFALTVTIALVSSLLVSLTIVPVLAYWFLRAPSPESRRGKKEAAAEAAAVAAGQSPGDERPGALQRAYRPIITWTLKYSALVLVLAIAVLGGTLAMTPFMKTNFLGSSGQNTFTVSQAITPGSSLGAQDALAGQVEAALIKTEGVKVVQVSIGSTGNSLRDAFIGGGDTNITYSVTTDEKADQQAVQDAARANVGKVVDPKTITIGASSGFGASSDISINITAPDQASLRKASDEVVKSMQGLSSVKQAESDLATSRPYIAVVVDREEAAKYGYTEVAVGGMVAAATNPGSIGTISIKDTQMNVYIASDDPPKTIAQLRDMDIPTALGPVNLSDMATIKQANGPTQITTIRGARSATVTVTPSADLGTANAQVSAALKKTTLPAGAEASIGGVTSDQANAFTQLGLALLAAILVVYIIMVATFKSLLQPLLLLVSIPFAATGAIALQVVTGVPLGVASLIGVLMLVGIVVTNAIVLIDLVNQYRAKGLAVREALIEGTTRRLRPILMTAFATVFALIPLAMGLTGSGGGFISQPLAIVVIGGLLSSTILTLIVLPVIYLLVEGGREKRKAERAAKKAAKRQAKLAGATA